jgi:hypothetical protein
MSPLPNNENVLVRPSEIEQAPLEGSLLQSRELSL